MNKERKKLGLALGSGSARGFAHLGILKVLEDNDIPIDFISGSSMGAVIGSIYACGTDLDMIIKFAKTLDEKEYLDVVIPRRGFIKGEKFTELITLFTKGYTFDQTKIPLNVVAYNLTEDKHVIFNSGKICEAVRASMSIPGVFLPFERDGIVYVDGGVVDRVPSETARNMGADVVIGVDVGFREGQVHPPAENLLQVLLQTFDVMGWETVKYKLEEADYVIAPDVFKVDPWTTKDIDECIEEGIKAGKAALDDIKRLMYG